MKTIMKNMEIGDDMVIARTTRRAAGSGIWAIGTMNGHRFEALVFIAHAENPEFELGTSCISKLWLKEQNGGETVANFDRGWDVRPRTTIAAAIVEFLAARLADLVYNS